VRDAIALAAFAHCSGMIICCCARQILGFEIL
jgi:hypothetical protein